MKYQTKVPQSSPIGDLMTRLRNGHLRNKVSVVCFASNLGKGILSALWREGFIFGYSVKENQSEVEVFLKYSEGLPLLRKSRLVSKPGRPRYFSVDDLKRYSMRNNFSVLVLTTSKGVLSSTEALSMNQGGKALVEVE